MKGTEALVQGVWVAYVGVVTAPMLRFPYQQQQQQQQQQHQAPVARSYIVLFMCLHQPGSSSDIARE
jgi:ABC-type Co2+ transport system permease subunit